jgi:hypothetical protein
VKRGGGGGGGGRFGRGKAAILEKVRLMRKEAVKGKKKQIKQ